MSEFEPNLERKLPPEALLHRVVTQEYDRLVQELKEHSGPIRMREFEYANEPSQLEIYGENFRNRFQPIIACADLEFTHQMWELGDEYVKLAIDEDKVGTLWPDKTDPKPFTPLHPIQGAYEIQSTFRVRNDSDSQIKFRTLADRYEAAPSGGDFMSMYICHSDNIDDTFTFPPSFVYDKLPKNKEGTIYTSPEMPPFFIPYMDRINLHKFQNKNQMHEMSTPSAYLQLMRQSNLPILYLSGEECLAVIDLLNKSHAIAHR